MNDPTLPYGTAQAHPFTGSRLQNFVPGSDTASKGKSPDSQDSDCFWHPVPSRAGIIRLNRRWVARTFPYPSLCTVWPDRGN